MRAIKREYDPLGRLEKVTSAQNSDGSGTVRNQVQFEFGSTTGLLYRLYQSHQSAVNTMNTPHVQFNYTSGDASGGVYTNGLRRRLTTYPDGRAIHMTFGATDSISDRLHRIDKLEEDSSGSPGTDLVEYDYNGTGRVSEASYLVPSVRNSFHGNDSDGEYEGWDRFGRTKFQQWHKHSTPTGRVDRWDYTYDYAGNRLTRDLEPTEVSGAPTDHDQLFTYDGLHRLKTYDEGQISGGAISSPTDEQDFTLDQLGNWANLLEKTGGSTTLDQDRAHNAANELTEIDASTTHVAEDGAGNMTKVPKPTSWSAHFDLKYDAWNRLVEVKDGGNTVQTNEYDGLNQRIVRVDVAASPDVTYDYYYNDQWQVLEERKNGDTDPLAQYVWHPYYIDALAVRYYDENTDNSGIVRHWYLQDANFNVTGIVNDSATVLERYHYTPYGEVTILDADFSVKMTQASAIGNNILYTGRERDPETGLQLNRERFYHAPLGRWLTRDPIEYEGGANFYEYVRSDPTSNYDPSGLQVPFVCQCRKIGGNPNSSGRECTPPANGWTLQTIAACYAGCIACNRNRPCPKADCQDCARACQAAHYNICNNLYPGFGGWWSNILCKAAARKARAATDAICATL